MKAEAKKDAKPEEKKPEAKDAKAEPAKTDAKPEAKGDAKVADAAKKEEKPAEKAAEKDKAAETPKVTTLKDGPAATNSTAIKPTNPPSNSTTMSGPDKPKVSHLSAFPIIMDPTLKKKEESEEANSAMKMQHPETVNKNATTGATGTSTVKAKVPNKKEIP